MQKKFKSIQLGLELPAESRTQYGKKTFTITLDITYSNHYKNPSPKLSIRALKPTKIPEAFHKFVNP